MKQSLKSQATLLNEVCGFPDLIKRDHSGIKMIAHCSGSGKRSQVGEVYSKAKDAVIIIGPEGDFSEDEIEQAERYGYTPVHLGRSRLRTETAGVAACHSIYFINQL